MGKIILILEDLIDQTIAIENADSPDFSQFQILFKLDDRELSIKEDIKIDYEKQEIILEAI